jgi:uncharacterized protein YjbI with pentapeptide repeats
MVEKVTNFSPTQHGFKFVNTFETDVIWGPAHITTSGRCGGMSYTALDCFFYNIPIPADTALPPEGSVLSTYIYERQMKSLEGTADQWVDFLFNPFGTRTEELHNRGRKGGGELLKLVAEIDAGRPCNVCLVAPSPDPSKSHQVVAFGYNIGTGANDLQIYICDPNHPAETIILYPDANASLYRYKYQSNNQPVMKDGQARTWIAYFTDTDYVKRRPPTWTDTTAKDYTRRNFSNQNLDHKDFRNDILIGANFTNASIKRTDFQGANATGAVFINAIVVTSNFIEAILKNTNFVSADLRKCRFDSVQAADSFFNAAFLGGVNFTKAVLTGSHLQRADLNRANLEMAVFHRCLLGQANLNSARLIEADFTRAYLASAQIGFITNGRKANFERANLDHADLRGSSFPNAVFIGANLGYAILNTTVVKDSDFTGASLSFADLRGADFRGAKLNFTNMMFADMRGAKFGNNDWTNTLIGGADIRGATGIPASIRRQVA